MEIDKLIELTCVFFKVTKEDFMGDSKITNLVVARHCFRVLANTEYGFSGSDISIATLGSPSNTNSSRKTILENGQFTKEYEKLKAFVKANEKTYLDIAYDDSGIQRVTNDAFDERFYKSPDKVNVRTGLPYFPAFHFITSLGAPESIGLTKWRMDLGHHSEYILKRSAEIGSFVHDCADKMIKSNTTIEHEDIHAAFEDAKEAHRVKECLLGFINFMEAEEPLILASEKMYCADDFGFTLDSKMRLKSDNYASEWVVDWKTSKTATEDHKMQVEAMRRASNSDKAMVVVLGNSTKKKYTATPVKATEQDHLWNKFNAIKETAYVEMMKRGIMQPREDNMPSSFSLNKINIKRKL